MILSLPDGSQLDISSKNVEVTGLLFKEKNFNVVDSMQIVDLQSSIVSLTTFDPQVKARTGYWTSFIKGSDKVNSETGVLDNRRDLIKIEIFKQVED